MPFVVFEAKRCVKIFLEHIIVFLCNWVFTMYINMVIVTSTK